MTTICPACKGTNNNVLFKDPQDLEYFVKRTIKTSILQCQICNALFQNPFPKKDEVNDFYPLDYQNYNKKNVPILSKLVKFINNLNAKNFIKIHGKNKLILDYGCGDFSFVDCLEKNKMQNAYGFDLYEREGNDFQKHMKFINSYEKLKKIGKFDIIRMHHVIEHLVDLDKEMFFLQSLLSKDGIILVQTPNPASKTLTMFGKFWGPLHYPFHTIILTPTSMNLASQRWKLKLTSSYPSRIMPTGWSMSIENLIKFIFKSSVRGRLPIYSFLALGLLPFSFLETLIFRNNSPIMNYVLSKND